MREQTVPECQRDIARPWLPLRWAEESFDGCPCCAVGKWAEAERPVIANFLADGCSKVGGLEVLSLCFRSLEASPAVVGGIQTVAFILHRPNREAVGGEYWAGLRWQRHGRLTASAVVDTATRLDGRHHDHASLGVEADEGSPVTDAQTPFAWPTLETSHIACWQPFYGGKDAISFVAGQLAQGLRSSRRDLRVPLGQCRRQRSGSARNSATLTASPCW